MPEGLSDKILTPTGITQGSLTSPILYLLYNADLIEYCGHGVTTKGWVDDVCFMASGQTERESVKKNFGARVVKPINERSDMPRCSIQKKCPCALRQLKRNRLRIHNPLILPETTVEATITSARDRGFRLDLRLEFNYHRHFPNESNSKSAATIYYAVIMSFGFCTGSLTLC